MNNKFGCLLIHGFGGSVDEVRPLAEFLAAIGYAVSCPCLKGHTGRKRDMKGVKYTDWINSAEKVYLKLKEDYKEIVIIGFSMGGLIGINLAVKYGAKAVVTINTPVYYWDIKRVLINIYNDINHGETVNINRYIQSSSSFTLSALINFRVLLGKTKPLIRYVKCPLYVLQAVDDDTVRRKSADYILKNAVSARKKLEFFDNSGHQMLHSPSAGKAIEHIGTFLENISIKSHQ